MKNILIFAVLSVLFSSLNAQKASSSDICKQIIMFGNNATFPQQAKIIKYKIAVFGKNSDVYNTLYKNFYDSKIHGKPVEFKNIYKISDLDEQFNIVYVDYSKNKSLVDIYNKIHTRGILLITYKSTDVNHIMVNLSDNNTYQIQSFNLIDENITLTENIIATGGNKFDLLQLYQQKVKLLSEKEDVMQNKGIQLDSLSKEVNNQKLENEKKEKLLNQQTTELKQKERKIEEQQKAINLQAFEIKVQKNIILITIIFVIIFVTLSFITYRALRKNRIITERLRQSNEEIKQQNEQIETQAGEIIKQRDLAVDRGNELEHKNKDIQDSIHYALRIQQALLPDISFLKNKFDSYFVFYKPRDIVSGDFYWADTKNGKTIVIAADCTGHGVPGAMMSMLGISFINEIYESTSEISSGNLLTRLSELIIKSLKQRLDDDSSTRDGMDMSVAIYDKENSIIENSGANNSIYIVSDKQPEIIEGFTGYRIYEKENSKFKLYEIIADKKPVGIYYNKTNDFVTKKVKVSKNDLVYMFSDGFSDMYSHNKKAKYTTKRFKDFLVTNSDKLINDQLLKIEQEYNEWLSSEHQIDDILVLGIRI